VGPCGRHAPPARTRVFLGGRDIGRFVSSIGIVSFVCRDQYRSDAPQRGDIPRRPDLDIVDTEALGIPVKHLPRDLWVFGLGHLGNACLWSLATLPYEDPQAVEFALFDFDNVEKDSVETGIISTMDVLRRFKTRACDIWLDRHGFQTRSVERRFDAT
jgi:hypothetical protein